MTERSQNPIGRRAFLMGSAGCVLAAGSGYFAPLVGLGSPMGRKQNRKVLFICVDGFGPDYLQQSDMPNLEALFTLVNEGMMLVPST